jgi:hypothetical protein
VTSLDDLRRNYRVAFLRYLPRREEAPLAAAYEIGRTAVGSRLSLLDIAQVHHEVLLEVLQDVRPGDISDLAVGASEFFLEVLATYEMAQRRLRSDT